jgi:hypothetical protein
VGPQRRVKKHKIYLPFLSKQERELGQTFGRVVLYTLTNFFVSLLWVEDGLITYMQSQEKFRQKVKPSSHQPCLSVCSCTWLQHKVWDWVEISKTHSNKTCSWQGQLGSKKSFRLIRQFNPIKTCRALGHGRATEEGRWTGFQLLHYGCQQRASALEHSSKWRNFKCLLYIYWKSKISSFRICCFTIDELNVHQI